MKLWVDDIRPAPDESWTIARTVTSAINFIAMFGDRITDISLDHDISYQVQVGETSRPYPSPETFQAVAHYIKERYYSKNGYPALSVHSANPVGRKAILDIFKGYLFCHEITNVPVANRLEQEV